MKPLLLNLAIYGGAAAVALGVWAYDWRLGTIVAGLEVAALAWYEAWHSGSPEGRG